VILWFFNHKNVNFGQIKNFASKKKRIYKVFLRNYLKDKLKIETLKLNPSDLKKYEFYDVITNLRYIRRNYFYLLFQFKTMV
jgi:hypothetical protein